MRSARSARPRPPLFRALGAQDPPNEVTVNGTTFTREEIYKHDSWAATAVYASATGERIVCKFNRTQSVAGLPMKWLGRRLATREARALLRLADLPRFPRVLGPVFVNGKQQRNAVARSYIAGHPLSAKEQVGANFFSELEESLRAMHERGIAYVDLHKRENIIVGDDGRPYLVDFQISYDATLPRVRHMLGSQWAFEQCRIADLYHLDKHRRRANAGEGATPVVLPLWIRLHRMIAVPFRQLRRRFLVARGIRLGHGSAATEVFAEDAVRRESARAA